MSVESRLVGCAAASHWNEVRLSRACTVIVQQKKEPDGTVTSLDGEKVGGVNCVDVVVLANV